MKKSSRPYYLIAFGNLIPLIGYLAFDWSLTESFMFYAAELCAYELVMLPRIVIFVFTSDEYGGSVFSLLVKSFLWLFSHLFLFVIAVGFLVSTAYSFSARVSHFTRDDIFLFIHDNYLVILFIFAEYIYLFCIHYIKLKEYKLLPSEMYLKEIGVFYMLFLIIMVLIKAITGFLEIEKLAFQLVMLVIIISIKIFVQLLLKKRKETLLAKIKEAVKQ